MTEKWYQSQATADLLYGYNANGWLTTRFTGTGTGSSTNGYTTTYTYDAVGNLTQINYPAGTASVTNQFDALNRLTNRLDGLGQTKYTYAVLGNGVRTARRSWRRTARPGKPPMLRALVIPTPRCSGRLRRPNDKVGQLGTSTGYRVSAVLWPDWMPADPRRHPARCASEFRLEALLFKQTDTGSVRVSAPDRVNAALWRQWTPNGPGCRAIRGRSEFRLEAAERTAFDQAGVIAHPVLLSANNSMGEWMPSAEVRYLYDLPAAAAAQAGLPAAAAAQAGLSGSLDGAGGIGGLLARSHGYSSGSWSYHNFYHADGNGNVTALVNSAGTLQASYIYDPFGRYLTSTGTMSTANTMRFSSKPWLASLGSTTSGVYYYGYRFY